MIKCVVIKNQYLALLICLIVLFFISPALAQKNQSEKIKSVKTTKGKFIRFVVGDYIHAQIKRSDSKTRYFFLDSYDLQYFLVVNRGKSMTFTYEIVDTYIGENNGRKVIERIKSAKIGNLNFENWWKDLRKKYTVEQIRKKYEPLVDRYTKN